MVIAAVLGAGRGARMGADLPKQFLPLGGKPVFMHSLTALKESGLVDEVLLLVPEEYLLFANDALEEACFTTAAPVHILTGGATRGGSLLRALEFTKDAWGLENNILITHDAARPFAGEALLRRLMEATSKTAGAIPVLPVADALKRVEGERVSAVDREGLFITQTPQSFYRPALIDALREHGRGAKDEAEAWLAAGLELHCVEGERLNFKVTWPDDLRMARALAEREREEVTQRTGLGYDVHRLVPDRPLILGGVRIKDSPLGLLGHSDADLLAHAIADALLGAAGLPDIGNLFPASDPAYRGADSMELLREVVRRVRGEGWRVSWVDAVVQAQVPRLNAHLPEMKKRLSAILDPGRPNCVNLKAKSAEGTGDEGRGGAMTCWAAATLCRVPGEEGESS